MGNIISANEEKIITGSEDLLENLVREGARKMLAAALEAEVTEFINSHLGVRTKDGHQGVVRNGYMPQRDIQSTAGNIRIRQPRVDDRCLADEERFSSTILPKFMRKTPTLENVIPTLYLKGISSNKFQDALSAIFGESAKGFSANTIIRLKEVWQQEYNKWMHRSLSEKEYVYVWADGVYCNARLDDEKLCLLVIIGVTVDGRKELVAVHQGVRESEQSWLEVLRELKSRGLEKAPKLAICDGALGFQNAVDKVWGTMKIQRCWFHKMGNVLDKMPECVQTGAKKSLQNIFLADTKENAQKAYNLFIETYELKYPKAAECLAKDYDDLFRFYDFPAEHWVHIRTSNPIESMFATVRLRHRSTKGNGSATATLAMVFKLCQEAEKNWRRLKGFEKLRLVYNNVPFVNGVLVEAA
jgi:transposase-like protein